MKFYATAKNTEGKSQLINFENMGENAPKYLFQAEQLAKDICKKEGFVFQAVHSVMGSQKQGSPLTKFFKERKRHRQMHTSSLRISLYLY